ncbi:MAG TPA: AGE family epimerase/isomerase [Fontimonas sp.]
MSETSRFRSRAFLREHLAQLMRFYHPRCIDPAGGYFQFFDQDGSAVDPRQKHLVSSARMIINYALAHREFGELAYVDAMRHGLSFLRSAHRNPQTGGYAWILRDGAVADATQHCYGLAFVMLAYARALDAGIGEARSWLAETWDVLQQRFWEPAHGLYADEATPDWRLSGYRGQNPNMHLCEALLAAHEATGESRYVERAAALADAMVNRQAAQCGGQVWEHYDADWQIDWHYNKGDRSNIFRPWGLQPGHQLEWAKLLLLLDRHVPQEWRLRRAVELFEVSTRLAWDDRHGGLIYGYDPDGAPYDSDKYSWVQVEAMAAAALLAARLDSAAHWAWYERIAAYSWQVFVDPRQGCWHRIRQPDNSPVDEQGCFSGLTDYHTLSACTDVMAVL